VERGQRLTAWAPAMSYGITVYGQPDSHHEARVGDRRQHLVPADRDVKMAGVTPAKAKLKSPSA